MSFSSPLYLQMQRPEQFINNKSRKNNNICSMLALIMIGRILMRSSSVSSSSIFATAFTTSTNTGTRATATTAFSSYYHHAHSSPRTHTKRWMSEGTAEKTEEEKAAIKAAREARKEEKETSQSREKSQKSGPKSCRGGSQQNPGHHLPLHRRPVILCKDGRYDTGHVPFTHWPYFCISSRFGD